ncbi:hypothetical protein NTD80_25195 [Pseudomonas sp. 13B_2.1_Bac1]|uniref:hypothetical protein n=1 Tax=Pseudomonas sp. 13B_2.1_Bac1 TaxID=2971624 RepID=UPI0021C5EC80|nr:hypothetical protein [Pseudomonas sp. 13B_2.1_Bac1]MCU1786056.1 hypothetical protein [Pseudomonas sp. 13B_2.1_Bac1]
MSDHANKENCTIIVNSCDNYEDVWLPFFHAFIDMWPNCNCKIILNTEHKDFKFDGLDIVTLNLTPDEGKKAWGWRLRKALSLVETEFVVSLFDDFILEAPVNLDRLARCIHDMKENPDITAFYFNYIPGANERDGLHDGFELIGKRNDYRLNSAPALWRTRELVRLTGEYDSPWAWEFFGSARTFIGNNRFYCAQADKEDTFIYNYAMGGAIRRGKWVLKVIAPAIKKYHLALDINKRGIASESLSDGKYSLRWKVDFFLLGFKMIGFKAFIFLYRVLIKKLFKGTSA